MSATAAGMQEAQPPTVCMKARRLCPKVVPPESARRTTIDDCDSEPIATGSFLGPIGVSETESAFCVSVPLNGVDPRHVYVLVSSHAITVEIRIKHTVPHSGTIYKECRYQCVTRELQLRSGIKEGSTRVQMGANRLEITCCKDAMPTERTWSEFVQLNTRASLGCVQPAEEGK